MKVSFPIRWIGILAALVPALVGHVAAEATRTPRVATLAYGGISPAATTRDADVLASYDPAAKVATGRQTGARALWHGVSATPIDEPFRTELADIAGVVAAEDGTDSGGVWQTIKDQWAARDDTGSIGRYGKMTARNYIGAAVEFGLDRQGGEAQLTEELIGQVCERVRPRRPDGHGESWRRLLAEERQIKAWVEGGSRW